MYNILLKILIVVIILSTLGILGAKPKMHKQVLVFDSSYSIVDEEPESEEQMILPEIKQVEVVEKKVSKVSDNKVETKTTPSKKVQVETKQDNNLKKEVKQVAAPKTVQNKEQKAVVQKAEPQKVVTQKPATTTVKQEAQKPTTTTVKQEVQKPVTVKQEAPKVVVKEQPKQTVLTEKEEEIAWNIWRSNLQNQIMRDVKLPYIPKGTVFKFSFDVDKYGRISNIKTWSLTPNYTPYALQYIAPVIRSYQGKDILDFPEGTQRLTTKFTGGWKISDSAVYSTPQDYNDIEKVKK